MNAYSSQTVSSVHSSSSNFHKLPKLALPTFNGDILRWQSFWDSFESTIHLNASLTEVQKFAYLQSQLEGPAASTIYGFSLTNANYTRAVSLLQERFGKRHKITHATMQALIQLPAPYNTISSMRQFCDKVETYVRGLESMGECQESYGSLLVPVILDKLPVDIRKNLAREHGDIDWYLNDLRQALNKELAVMEAGNQTHLQQVAEYQSTASFYAGTKRKTGYHDNQFDTSKRNERSIVLVCAFCDGSHKSVDCTRYPDTQTRLQRVKSERLCFNCLSKHLVVKCKSHKRCQICKKKHHTSICSERSSTQTQSTETTILHSSMSAQGILLKTAISKVNAGHIQTEANILFDEGAQTSFITESLAQELQLPRTGTQPISLATFGNNTQQLQHLETSTVYVVADRSQKIPVHMLIVPTIAAPISTTLQHTASKLPYLKGLKLAHPVTDDQCMTISLLIGADHYWDIVEDHVIRGNGPTAVRSKLGYLLSGPVNTTNPSPAKHLVCNIMTSHVREDAAIERFWTLESMGIQHDIKDQQKLDSLRVYQQTSITFEGNKYTAALPWKDEHDPLPSNYEISKKRTENMIRRLSKEPGMLKKYNEIILEQEQSAFIEKVDMSSADTERVHYIPHHPVRKDSSTTPIRIVYDCSCKQVNHPSLNDCLESTAPVLNELTSILLRFRQHQYAATTDKEKAFLHIALHEKDRDMTRFLWLSNPSDPTSTLCAYRFKAVLFGATCSPFILNATILKHLELNKPDEIVSIIERNLYVDNIISSFPQETDVLNYFWNARGLMTKASMNLRSWTSNSETLRHTAEQIGVLDNDAVTKVLGMRWKPEEDMMLFTDREIPTYIYPVTKRSILKYSSRIYDPLGLLSPVTVRAKLLLQQLWKEKYDWDNPLPDYIQNTWSSLLKDLNTVLHTEFPGNISRQQHTKKPIYMYL